MNTLLLHLWPALAAASLLGLAFGSVFGPGAGLPSARLDVRWGAILLLLAGVLVMALELVPGRAGLWFEIGILCACAYAIGTMAGAVLRMLLVRNVGRKAGHATPDAAERAG
jgi:hypothetical protein